MVISNKVKETSKQAAAWNEENLLADITELLDFQSHTNIPKLLKDFLQKAKKFASVDLLCIYHARADKLSFTKLAAIEKDKPFPKSIAAGSLKLPGKMNLWLAQDKPEIRLHEYAREVGLAYLITTQVGQDEGPLGLIAAGGFQVGDIDVAQRRLSVVAGLIGAVLQEYIYEMYLSNQNQILTQRNDILSTVFNNTKDAALVVDKNFKVTEINSTAEQILGYSYKEVENRLVSDVLIGADGLMDALEVALAGIETHELGIQSLHQRNGQAFCAHIRALPLMNSNDKSQGILLLISDENENQQNRIKVQHMEQRAALGSLSAIFAHEVKNPINNIYLAVQLMQSRTPDEDPNFEVLSRIYNDCSRLRDLMDSILSFSRPVEPKRRPINITAQLSSILDRWRPRFERLDIVSNPLFSNENLMIEGDTRMVDQIFTNLINNAVDAMEATGGTLSIKATKSEQDSSKPLIEITVSDSGPGMPDDVIEKIFQPFKTTKNKGTGLGLAITKHMVTALHGTIQAESFTCGCVFTVRFPQYSETTH